MKKIKAPNSDLLTVTEFLNVIPPKDTVSALPELGYKAVIRVENTLSVLLETTADYRKTITDAEEAVKNAKKGKDTWDEKATQSVLEKTEFWQAKDKEVEVELGDEKYQCVQDLLKNIGFNYFTDKKRYIAICELFGVTE